ncbi:pre-mRNA-splicing factor SYF2 [Aspergillus ruber CBS 135680]|uniref:Pre-mRNA-splicing factor SYF2 n=1 Tax=Aspergillus ruber (strain CBS 135680) TaxID=1388766 RepID=A0A017SSH6_ASPRC|nr:Pre-mRNA-splicing factor syf2 [Aspergillus ruber CBS 135680]EYE99937.1 Pre-mRNA-splicing factor syf2 [Aspergillus ruber CBS 135680]
MPPKRETDDSTATPADSEQAAENLPTGGEDDDSEDTNLKIPSEGGSANATAEQEEDDAAAKARQRHERFKALQARAKSGAERNLKETAAETQRLATDPALMSNLSRKHAFASHNLLKADTEVSGEDFERKRAWDWTVDESEKWDKRMNKKQRHRDDVAFQDYTQDARKVYKRQMRELNPNLEAYEREKMAAIEKAASNGDLEIVETSDGEMIAIDKNGSFYSTADSVGFAENKPDRAGVDKLVGDLKKAEEVRLKKRRDRRGDDESDVTYINEKNKQFNMKLSRFYNKYTTEIRDSFERGTMI